MDALLFASKMKKLFSALKISYDPLSNFWRENQTEFRKNLYLQSIIQYSSGKIFSSEKILKCFMWNSLWFKAIL